MTETIETIETEALCLNPLGLADASVIVEGHRPAEARWAPGYPTDLTLVAAGLVITAARGAQDDDAGPYRVYQVIRKADRCVIGDCGFLGPPDESGDLHAAYGVAEVEAGHRHAAEALGALIEWARRQPGVRRVLSEAAATNIASIRVMERAGMRRLSGDGDLVCFAA